MNGRQNLTKALLYYLVHEGMAYLIWLWMVTKNDKKALGLRGS